jgi:L-fucose isomerase
MPNCGAQCTWFAGRAAGAAENLSKVQLRPSFRPGGGATTYFVTAPGELTLARLFRRNGEYVMAIIPGQAVEPDAEAYEAFVNARGSHQLPTTFVRVSVDMDTLVAEFGSNHVSGVDGACVEELEHVCRLLDITPIVLK